MKNKSLSLLSAPLLFMIFLTIVVPNPTFAASKGGIKSGSIFYVFDILLEKAGLVFTVNKEKRVKKIISNSEERLEEAEMAISEGKYDIAEKAILKYQDGISSAFEEAEKINDEEKSKEVIADINQNFSEHQDILISAYNMSSESAKKSFERTIINNEVEKTDEEPSEIVVSPKEGLNVTKSQNKEEKIDFNKQVVSINDKGNDNAVKIKEIITPNMQKQTLSEFPAASNDTESKSKTEEISHGYNKDNSSELAGGVMSSLNMASSSNAVPAIPAVPATPAINNNSAIPATPATPASPSNFNKPPSSQTDITPPVISNIQTVNIAETSATSTWKTDELASGELYYATSFIAVATSTIKISENGNVTNHVVVLTNLSAGTTYYYIVVSKDVAGNTSTSSEQSFTTLSPPPPVVNDNLGPWITNLSISPTSINPGDPVTFTATAEDPNGIGSIAVDIKYPPCTCHDSDYYLRSNFNFSGATSGTQTFTETIDHGISPTILGDYVITTIRAVDSLGNLSTYYPDGTVTGARQETHVLTIPVINVTDTISPSVPDNLSVSSVSPTQVSLSWAASTDNISVIGYKVFRHGIQIATTTTNSYIDSGLYSKTSYGYTVSAYDSAGNESDRSSGVSITTDISGNPAIKLPDDWKNPNDFSHILTSGRQQVAKFQLWANVPGIEWKQISLHVSLSPGLTASNWEIQDQSNTAYTYGVSATQNGDIVTFSTSGLGIYNTYSGVGYSVYAKIDGDITSASTVETKFIDDSDFVWNNSYVVEGLPTVPQIRYGGVQ